MANRRGKSIDPFHHPLPGEVDFEALLAVLKECRQRTSHLRAACGHRNPLAREAEALIAQIDAVAALTRIPGAEARVNPPQLGHSTRTAGQSQGR